jgi:acid phosphatase (class A)
MAVVLARQAARTDAEIAEARADQKVSAFRFADVLGPGFAAERLPLTGELTRQACLHAQPITVRAKEHWDRPRPGVANPAVKPVLVFTYDGSYPSGHATCGYLWGILLGDMLPERRGELLARGVRYGTNRVTGGVHYPSDAEAGRLSATAIATVLYRNPEFRRELAAARAELRAALGYVDRAATR